MLLNVDDITLTNPKKTCFGGLVRNHEGPFQFSFYGRVIISNVLHGEIKILLTSIEVCWQAGFKKLLCFSDSLPPLRDYLEKDWHVSLCHTLCEGNNCDDILTKMKANYLDHLFVVQEPLSCLSFILSAYVLGVSFIKN
jgi:hypothetical protein